MLGFALEEEERGVKVVIFAVEGVVNAMLSMEMIKKIRAIFSLQS